MEVDCDNAAFDDIPASELAGIIEKARRAIMRGQFDGVCYDSNGNRVGEWAVTGERPSDEVQP
jgi:hypothetical protein